MTKGVGGPDTQRRAARALDALNFFLADVRGGLGPYLAVYLLTVRNWNEAENIGQDGAIVYANKRAEMWGAMRAWLAGGMIPDDRELLADLTGVEYGYVLRDGRDAIILEKKEDMKKRGVVQTQRNRAFVDEPTASWSSTSRPRRPSALPSRPLFLSAPTR
jgi:hypothetical protein